jgi:hypothetical protein
MLSSSPAAFPSLPWIPQISISLGPDANFQPSCQGSGLCPKWISLADFAVLLEQEKCQGLHTSSNGSQRFSAAYKVLSYQGIFKLHLDGLPAGE